MGGTANDRGRVAPAARNARLRLNTTTNSRNKPTEQLPIAPGGYIERVSFSQRLFGALSWPDGIPPALRDQQMPLKVGIYDELALTLPDAEWGALSRALRAWCSASVYLLSVATDELQRHSIDGSSAGPVSENDRHGAACRLLAGELARARKRGAP